MKILIKIVLFVTLFGSNNLMSQTNSNRRLFFEIGGNAGFGSINYEQKIEKWTNNKMEFVFRTGLSGYPRDAIGAVFIFPNSLNLLLGANVHKLELGFGQSVSISTKADFFLRTVLNVGYRYQSDKPVFYRITYTPIISNIWDVQYQHWAGVSIGYQFN